MSRNTQTIGEDESPPTFRFDVESPVGTDKLTLQDDCSLVHFDFSADDNESQGGSMQLATVSQAVRSLVGLTHCEQLQTWISSRECVLTSIDKKPIMLALSIDDLAYGDGMYYIHKKDPMYTKDEIKKIKETLASWKEGDNGILQTVPSGYSVGKNTQKESSRFSVSFDDMSTERGCSTLNLSMNKYRTHMSTLISETGLIGQGDSLLWDDGSFPHIQLPHTDYFLTAFDNSKDTRPLSSIYALEDFSILLFCFGEGTVGGTIPIRVSVTAGETLIFSGDLWHSGDTFETDENLRIHSYLVPETRTEKLYPDRGVNREGGRKDLFLTCFSVCVTMKGRRDLDFKSLKKYLAWDPVPCSQRGTNDFEYLEKCILQSVILDAWIGHYGYGNTSEREDLRIFVQLVNQMMMERCGSLGMNVSLK
jgi:hypothetical protein